MNGATLSKYTTCCFFSLSPHLPYVRRVPVWGDSWFYEGVLNSGTPFDSFMKEHCIFRATQVKQDSVKKQADCSNNITKYEAKYREKCAEIGIVGDQIKSELSGLVLDIPYLMTEISRSLGHIQPAISYYQVHSYLS